MSERFYVTTPIYYINDVPHLGSAYTTIAADVLCRYHRLRGHESHFLTGTDEHGLKIQREAEQRGQDPQAFANAMSAKFESAWPELGCAPDDFIRTSSQRHKRAVQELWKRIALAGDIYLGHYEGLYCVGCEAYYTDKELLNRPGGAGALCPIHERPVERMKEESYFFRLSKFGERLSKFYAANPGFVQPEGRMNEVKSFVEAGLQDLSVSRTTFRWGVPVPGDDRHVMYVWFDALTNYWSALHPSPDEGVPDRRRFWPPAVHLMGKDILRFHAVYWPAFLMAAGFSDAELPQKVLAHGFLSYGGRKMSKSLRNTISPRELAQAVHPEVGVDVVRYCLMRSISFGHDGDFSIDDVLARYASDLGNTLGNLLNRVLPFAPPLLRNVVSLGPLELELRVAVETAAREAAAAFDACLPTRALEAIWGALTAANGYVDRAAPWTAKKQDALRLDTIVMNLIEVLEATSVMIAPVMPKVAAAMREQLGLARLAPEIGRDQWPFAMPRRMEGASVRPGTPLFPRLEKERAAELRARFAAPDEGKEATVTEEKAPEPAKPAGKASISYDDFAKIELRVGIVVAAEKVAKKDRLLSLKVDVGEGEPRALVAGIATSYAPEALIGRRIVVLCNLEPKKFGGGLVSHGMLLAADAGEGPRVLGVDGELPPGAPIK